MTPPILEIALPTPLRRYFDYLPPTGYAEDDLQPGIRLTVPFGRRTLTGILVRLKATSTIAPAQLKKASAIIDKTPVLCEHLLTLAEWAARYYHYPPGEALFHALPPTLRKGRANSTISETAWHLTTAGLGVSDGAFKNAPRQQQAWQYLLEHQRVSSSELIPLGLSRSALQALTKKELTTIEDERSSDRTSQAPYPLPDDTAGTEQKLHLNDEQRTAVSAISAGLGHFDTYLLEGVTGSGKTEVYLQAITQALALQLQVLVLVPEIGLTPQTIARFTRRFGDQVVAMHSQLSDSERLNAWRAAALGQARIVIGTRSAVFTPFRSLGLIVIDEEHDTSYKQQTGLRYSARDIAVKRAHMANIPIVLGSATPAIETLFNAGEGRYHSLRLQQRAGSAKAPELSLVDMRQAALNDGFCQQTLGALRQTIAQGNQALIYINRRGFAPTLMCHACGWVAECEHCDAKLVMHKRHQRLRCHHCDFQQALPSHCPQCHQRELQPIGQGTERSEHFLKDQFPTTTVLRIDRDTTSSKGSLDALLERVHSAEPALLIGTQMLAKGHHFEHVTLVAIIDADAGLYSADFRGPERTAQMLIQVAGRAGRAEKPGKVLVQTHTPEHPVLALLAQGHYRQLNNLLLDERRHLNLPPYGYLAVIHCSGSQPERIAALLEQLKAQLPNNDGLVIIGPVEPPIAKLAGRFRCQLLFKHTCRSALHRSIHHAVHWLEATPEAKRLRWSVDIDPQDFI